MKGTPELATLVNGSLQGSESMPHAYGQHGGKPAAKRLRTDRSRMVMHLPQQQSPERRPGAFLQAKGLPQCDLSRALESHVAEELLKERSERAERENKPIDEVCLVGFLGVDTDVLRLCTKASECGVSCVLSRCWGCGLASGAVAARIR